MEEQSILNVSDEDHIQVLHLVFKERIQDLLDSFVQALLRRPIRSENYQTPIQLWIKGQTFDPFWEPQTTVRYLFYFYMLVERRDALWNSVGQFICLSTILFQVFGQVSQIWNFIL